MCYVKCVRKVRSGKRRAQGDVEEPRLPGRVSLSGPGSSAMAAAVAVSVSVEAAPERCGLEEEEEEEKEEEEGGGREECVANDEPAEEEEEEGGAAALSVGGPGPGAGTQSRLARLPLSRVKALMKMDPDVSLASQESVFAIAKATELFVEMIAKDALVYAQQGKRKTLQRKDLDNAIEAIDEFAFLEGTLD
ncbi:DNA polymerase epsilon subunit 4 [Scleropages formosus]|uniref:DNA polymerase epsilon subunit 4 n=1 Tax=Scleropages formosus TaxID=113540 RepID=A0A8C9TPY0_SCLFO|nr:DNA polymerase epsilon subunit 4 [Scleropages formosus]